MPNLEEKITMWVEAALEQEMEDDEHYDVEVSIRYVKNPTRIRVIGTAHIVLYTAGGFERIVNTWALDHPDQDVIVQSIQDSIDCLRIVSQGSSTLRQVEDILELLDEEDEED